jgi:MerR family mercuric resistance operon transcriptional regulator
LLALAAHRRGTDELHRRAQVKLDEIEARIANLQQIRENLHAVLAARSDSLTNCSCGLALGLPLETL